MFSILRFEHVRRAINPMIRRLYARRSSPTSLVQALLENSYYERQNGEPLTASFMDYAMPRAETLPFLSTTLSEIPSPTNRLGVRSGGDGGTTLALAAVINGIVDALAERGVNHLELPATPERVWRAMQTTRSVRTAAS